MRAFTIGHSTHPLETFAALLAEHRVERVADVRRTPRSSRHPHFNLETLAGELAQRAIDYRHLPALGGRRRASPGSPNGGWEHPAFRGYADYALTDEFAAGLAELCALAEERPTAAMCAEAPWWRCHRRLIADRLTALGWTVCHIASDGGLAEHELPPFAVVTADGTVTYPPAQGALPGL
ncbi:DUF488 domain-containing protein [Candidatus Solirubrobacter pratensis]|uniref:DUF488 domain-containing protein n=1 Tax=Candidatus Solirubrobacter pratensis TaxID=1298857 RepID=UPI00040BC335|nr:DUF488 domain-containing protein [Candidatus Solirubrobacter pratensis]